MANNGALFAHAADQSLSALPESNDLWRILTYALAQVWTFHWEALSVGGDRERGVRFRIVARRFGEC